jgi:hypothetical protein
VIKIPIYRFLCECGNEMEEICPISKRVKELPCDKCGKLAPRNYAHPKACLGFSEEERISRSMGVHPSQIEAAMKKWPGSTYDKNGNLRYKGRSEKLRRLKQRGLIETG